MKALLLLNFIIPSMLLLCSHWLKTWKTPYPGPAINQIKWKVDFSGYNTPLSRKSQAHWDYAQQIAPAIFLRRGKQALFSAVCFTLVGLIGNRHGLCGDVSGLRRYGAGVKRTFR